MGGNIGVDSRKGTGACFFVELPLEVEGADQPPAPALAGFHVLVWSPHLETRTALAMQLRRLGATANVVRETAAVAAAGGEHDAILLACPTCNELKPSLQELLAEASAGKGPPILLQTYGVPADTLNMFISGPRVLSVRGFQRTAALAASLLSLIVPGSGPASAAAPPAADRSGTAALSPLRLLLADDNAINRKLVKTLLAGAAVEIVEAADGEQALAAVSAERFDLIFLDVHMPGMSGIDVTARLRREETPNHATPVIALTADALPSTRSHCLAAGFNDVVVKPIDSQGLWRVVRHWTGSDAGPPAAAEPAPPAAAENAADGMSLYDHAAAVHKSGGRPELAVDLLKMLLDELPEQGQALDTAVSAGDAERVRQQVHRLHGSAVYCCTPALAHSSGQLESAARRRDWDAISEWHAVLRQDVADLLDAGLDGLLQPPA